MLVKLQCPQCGAPMEIDDQQEQVFCSFCGTKIANIKEKVEITQNVNVSGTVRHVMDHSNEPNLYISYGSANPSVVMVVRIVDTGTKNTYFNGQTQTYHLCQGSHDIVLKIGRKNYNRTIFIPSDNTPVRINAAYNGRHAEITIDQPYVSNVISAEGSYAYQPMQQTVREKKKPQSVFAIIAFVLSLTVYGAVIGVPLAIFDLIRSKKDKEHSHGLAIAGLIIGMVFLTVLVPSWLGLRDNDTSISDKPNRSRIEMTEDPNAGKQEKNGFDAGTNRSCQFHGYSIQIPDYYYDRGKDAETIKFGTAPKDADAYIVFCCFSYDTTTAKYNAKKDEFSNSFIESIDGAKVLDEESVKISGFSGTMLRGSCAADGFDSSFILAHMYDPIRKNLLCFNFVQKNDSAFDYAPDAEKIINSLQVESSVENTPSATQRAGNTSGIRPEFKKSMDAYLAFF